MRRARGFHHCLAANRRRLENYPRAQLWAPCQSRRALTPAMEFKRKTMARIHIAAAGNVAAPANLALVAVGFELDCDRGSRSTAGKGDAIFSADSPLELLGLAAMYDARGLSGKRPMRRSTRFWQRFRHEI